MSDHLSQEEIDKILGKSNDEDEDKDEEAVGAEEGLQVKKAKFNSFSSSEGKKARRDIENFGDVILNLSVELGKTSMTIRDILKMSKDSVITLEKLAGDDVNILVNNQRFAQGEIVIINDSFGLRITNF